MSIAVNPSQVPSPYIYEAESDVELRQVPADEVLVFIKANPDVLLDLLTRLYRGVDGLLGRITHLMASSAKSRLIFELIIEARRFGTEQDDNSVLLTINEKDLGGRAGLSRETVSREVNKLKSEDLIKVQTSGIVVKSLELLEKKLGKSV